MNTGPAFEMVVLGSGGGPLETDCSGYLVKPYAVAWEDGFIGLEGGSGIGALSDLLERGHDLFPNTRFPGTHDTALLKAAYIFSYLTCYLITHAHLDHCLSLILLTGSLPHGPEGSRRPPVYGSRETLTRLAAAYGGGLWPELGGWDDADNVGVRFSPLAPDETNQIKPLPITVQTYPVAHGCTSHGLYESSTAILSCSGRDFVFFGDLEVTSDTGSTLAADIWRAAAKSWNEGRLAGVFIECSYDTSRPAHLMFGHTSPPQVYRELGTLANLAGLTGAFPLRGLRVFITHIKPFLVPHSSGRTAQDIIMEELNDLEADGGLGVDFIEVKRGDRILI